MTFIAVDVPAVGFSLPYDRFFTAGALVEEVGKRTGDYLFHLVRAQCKGVGIRNDPHHRSNPVSGRLRSHVIQQAEHPHILRAHADFFMRLPQCRSLKAAVRFFAEAPGEGYLALVVLNLPAALDEEHMVCAIPLKQGKQHRRLS